MIYGRHTAHVFRVKTHEGRRAHRITTQFPNFFVVFVLFVVNLTFLLPLTKIAHAGGHLSSYVGHKRHINHK